MAKTYEHLFFDLDNTLWDFDKNSEEALIEIYNSEKLFDKFRLSIDSFILSYKNINQLMWKYHREGKVNKESLRQQRFILTFEHLGIKDDELAAKLNEQYIQRAMAKTHLMPHTIETLDYLKEKYTMHIITNGFEESQTVKLKTSGIHHYFTNLVTCESASCTKPNRKIFEYALKVADTKRKKSLMIGDNLEIDIIGARRAGIDQVLVSNTPLNRREKITYHIPTLLHLKKIL